MATLMSRPCALTTALAVLHCPVLMQPAHLGEAVDSMLTPVGRFQRETSKLRAKLAGQSTTGAALSTFQADGSNGSTLKNCCFLWSEPPPVAAYVGVTATQWNPSSTTAATLNASANTTQLPGAHQPPR